MTDTHHTLDAIILASQSQARQALLKKAGLPIHIRPTFLDESPYNHQDGATRASERALAKLQQALNTTQQRALIIAADQTLTLQNTFFHKAHDHAQAHKTLTTLQGKTHHLHSAVAVGLHTPHTQKVLFSFTETTALTMKALSSQDIHQHLQYEEWKGAVGCYRIEGHGHTLFQSVPQDTSAISGLPLPRLLLQLQRWHIVPPITFPLRVPLSPIPHSF